MIVWGVSAFGHDGAIAIFKDNELIKYESCKDPQLNQAFIDECLKYGNPNKIYFYENPYKKKLRQLFAGQFNELKETLPHNKLKEFNLYAPVQYTDHHLSHAALGYFTSEFKDAVIITMDGIGEFETLTMSVAKDNVIKKVYSKKYPDSLGLFYSAFTQRIGLSPLKDESKLIWVGQLGTASKYKGLLEEDLVIFHDGFPWFEFKENFHRGCQWYRPEIQDIENLAAAVQSVFEEIVQRIIKDARKYSDNLIISGGSAMNTAVREIANRHFDNVYIPKNPGDSGSAIGCVLAHEKIFI